LTVLTTRTESPSNQTAILFLRCSFLTTAKPDSLDYMSQPSFIKIYDCFSTVGTSLNAWIPICLISSSSFIMLQKLVM